MLPEGHGAAGPRKARCGGHRLFPAEPDDAEVRHPLILPRGGSGSPNHVSGGVPRTGGETDRWAATRPGRDTPPARDPAERPTGLVAATA